MNSPNQESVQIAKVIKKTANTITTLSKTVDLNVDLSDFGQEPIFYAKWLKGSEMGLLGLISSFILCSAFSPASGLISVLILLNDWKYVYNKSKLTVKTETIPEPTIPEPTIPEPTIPESNDWNTKNRPESDLSNDPGENDPGESIPSESILIENDPSKIKNDDWSDLDDDLDDDWDNADNLPQSLLDTNPEADLGLVEQILKSILFDIPAHIALVSVTRCGKTLTLRAFIYGLLQAPDGRQNKLRIVDFKRSTWMGLENVGAVTYLCKNKKISVDPLISEIDDAYQVLCDRIEGSKKNEPRYWLIIDEWYRTLPKLKNHEFGKDALEKMNDIAQAGLEYGIHLLLVTQNHQCEAFGFDSQARFAFRFAAIGRQNDYRTINSILNDQYMIPSTTLRKESKADFRKLISNLEEQKRPIMVSITTGQAKQLPDFQWLENYILSPQMLESSKVSRVEKKTTLETLSQADRVPTKQSTTPLTDCPVVSVYQYLQKKGTLTIREIQQAKISNCQGFKKTDFENLLQDLEDDLLVESLSIGSSTYYKVREEN